MKKYFIFTAIMALVSVCAIAQEQEGDTYPKLLGYEYSYNLDGVKRNIVNTDMLTRIVELEKNIQSDFSVVARRWYSQGWKDAPNGQGYGYDTIAQYTFKKGKEVLVNDERLASDEYKDVLWSLMMQLTAVSETDTVTDFIFNYNTDTYLSYYKEADTSYTAYAGRPYNILTVENPMYLPLTYTSSDKNVATVNEETGFVTVVGKGETMITASFAGNKDIKACSADWKLVVKEGDYFKLEILSSERSEHTWGGGGGTYLAFDMVEVTSENAADIYGDGKLSFDIETRTLTMNNYNKTFTEEEDQSMGWMDWLDYESGPLPLNIKVVGSCSILHNSAGIYSGYDINIIGDGEKKSRLTLFGRFPQLSAGHDIIIDGVQVHIRTTTPHPLMMCETLHIEDNSYLDAFVDVEWGSEEEAFDAGAQVGEIFDVKLGDNIVMYTKDVHVAEVEGRKTFVNESGKPVMRIEIGQKKEDVVADDVTFSALELTDDPTGTEANGILYTLTEKDEVDKTEGCLVINSTMKAEDVSKILDNYLPGSTAFAEKYKGICFLLPVGKGNIAIDLQTTGNYQLAVQIGTNEPKLLSQASKGTVDVPFDCKIATYAYIYAVSVADAAAPARRNINAEEAEGSVKLFALRIATEETAIETAIEETEAAQTEGVTARKVLRNGQVLILRDGKTYDLVGTELK